MSDEQDNPYRPPVASSGDHFPEGGAVDLDAMMARLQPTALVKAAIWMVASLGGLLVFGALQLWDAVRITGALRVMPYAMAVVGVASLVLSVRIYRLRFWAALAALILSALSALAMALWFLVAGASGFVSFIPPLAAMIGVLAAVFAGLALGPCSRATEARRRLAESGVPVDF